MTEQECRERLKDKHRIVVKIGSSSLTHEGTGDINLDKLERLVRVLTDLRNQGREVILVSSGAIAAGRRTLGFLEKPKEKSVKQACAAVGQARLMMLYQKLFAEYNQLTAQILLTKYTMINDISRRNAHNTFLELAQMKVIPIVNENDTVSTDEIEFGDNDTLSALVAALVGADMLILLSDIDGLYTDDPRSDREARLISYVPEITGEILSMGKDAGSDVGTGGMSTKITAARIAAGCGADMVIANGEDVGVIRDIMAGRTVGTLFPAHRDEAFDLRDYLHTKQYPAERPDSGDKNEPSGRGEQAGQPEKAERTGGPESREREEDARNPEWPGR
ncbi:MAG: glutamate 5-kinase, partial [Lachnospiraceae bacterium]|nr:glutamate 5-kinase [Lachnospiraceae bacterium]